MQHLDAINLRLSNERNRLANARTASEIEYRQVLVKQIEKELANELEFLGGPVPAEAKQLTTDELFAELMA